MKFNSILPVAVTLNKINFSPTNFEFELKPAITLVTYSFQS